MNASTSAVVTSLGSFATSEKNTFKSKACASSVFARALAATNSRYASTSGWPSWITPPSIVHVICGDQVTPPSLDRTDDPALNAPDRRDRARPQRNMAWPHDGPAHRVERLRAKRAAALHRAPDARVETNAG